MSSVLVPDDDDRDSSDGEATLPCTWWRIAAPIFTMSVLGGATMAFVFVILVPLFQRSGGPPWYAIASHLGVVVALSLALTAFFRAILTHPGMVPRWQSLDHVIPLVVATLRERQARTGFAVTLRQRLPATTSGVPNYVTTTIGGEGDDGSNGVRPGRLNDLAMTVLSFERHCPTCRVLKIGSTYHCSSCGCCVLRGDHHCAAWFGRCIAAANHKYFLVFLFYVSVACAVVVAVSSAIAFGSSGIENAGAFAVWIFHLMFSLVVIPFLTQALETVEHNTSTIERLKARRQSRQRMAAAGLLSGAHDDEDSDGTLDPRSGVRGRLGLVRVASSAADVPVLLAAAGDAVAVARDDIRLLDRVMGAGPKWTWILPTAPRPWPRERERFEEVICAAVNARIEELHAVASAAAARIAEAARPPAVSSTTSSDVAH